MEPEVVTTILSIPSLAVAGLALYMLNNLLTKTLDTLERTIIVLLAMHPPQQPEDAKNTAETAS